MTRALLCCILLGWSSARGESLRLTLLTEPHTLDPQTLSASGGNYLFNTVYRGLFRYRSDRGLIPEGARSCERQHLKMTCQLNREHRWSDGSPIVAEDYVRAFRRLIDPSNRSPQSELLFNLKNALLIWQNQAKPSQLGVFARGEHTLEFEFAREDYEFEYKLITPATAPWPARGSSAREQAAQQLFSGPYKIAEWKIGHYAKLVKNENYGLKSQPERPPLEFYFVDNDTTALRLYEGGKINFLRRLTAGEIPRFKGKPDFVQVPIARFDYVGFGPQLAPLPKLRQALVESIDFKTFMSLFDTQTPPGCSSLPSRLVAHESCMKFDLKSALKAFKDVSVKPKLEFQFSKMGGDDIARAGEWFQGQWKKNLGVRVELESVEQTSYLQQLRVKAPTIFRKGVSLERPTCLAALELFAKDNRDNYLHLEDPKYENLLEQLRGHLTEVQRKQVCGEAIAYLLSLNRLIPLGQMYFTLLVHPQFKGWHLNELNQLDLTDLIYVQSP